MSLDSSRGWVFCGTGSPSYDHWGGNRVGQNLFGNCVLDRDTGQPCRDPCFSDFRVE